MQTINKCSVFSISFCLIVIAIVIASGINDDNQQREHPDIQVEGEPGVRAANYYFLYYCFDGDIEGALSLMNDPIYSGSWGDGVYYTKQQAREEMQEYEFEYDETELRDSSTFIFTYDEIIAEDNSTHQGWAPLMSEGDYQVLIEDEFGRDQMVFIWSWVVDRWLITAVEM